jgi:hypothetical protein
MIPRGLQVQVMKFRTKFLIIAVAVFFVTLHTEYAFSQQPSACQPNTICVHSGDILKYSATLGRVNSSDTFSFGDMLDSNHIRVIEQSQANGSEIKNYTMILSLKTGYAQSEQDSSVINPFFTVLASPITYNTTDTSLIQAVVDFNGFKRIALVALHSTQNSTSKIEYDIQTGILLERHTSDIIIVGDRPRVIDFTDKLIDTNIINSDSSGIQVALTNTVISIPSWVKNNAKYWHDGAIDDPTFAQGIQYMIKQGIITIPPTQSGQANSGVTIPAWVKNNAGYWATGDIDDATFVKGVQYLITAGIIQP